MRGRGRERRTHSLLAMSEVTITIVLNTAVTKHKRCSLTWQLELVHSRMQTKECWTCKTVVYSTI